MTAPATSLVFGSCRALNPGPRKARFDPKPVYMGFMVDKVTLKDDILRVPRLLPVRIIQPVLYHIFPNTGAV